MQSLLVDNAKTQRCQGVKRFEGRFDSTVEFLAGFGWGCGWSFFVALPLDGFCVRWRQRLAPRAARGTDTG